MNKQLEVEILLGTLDNQPHWCPYFEETTCSAVGACASLDIAIAANCKRLIV